MIKDMSAIITNFKNMLLYIGKIGSRNSECPMNDKLLGTFIDYLFNDQARVSRIPIKYMESRQKLDALYQQKGMTVEQAIKNRDRSIFKHIELFPENLSSQYSDYIKWFSTFLAEEMEEKYIVYIWLYLDKIDEQCLKDQKKHKRS